MNALKIVVMFSYKQINHCLQLLQQLHNYTLAVLLFKQNIIPKHYIYKLQSAENHLQQYSPFTIMFFTLMVMMLFHVVMFMLKKVKGYISEYTSLKELMYMMYLKTSSGKRAFAQAQQEAKVKFNYMFKTSKYKKLEFLDKHQDKDTVLFKLRDIAKGDNNKANCGKLTGAVYCANSTVKSIASEALDMFVYSNLLHPDIYTGARFIESQLIKLGLNLFNGKDDSCGLTTSGGTYSILTAVYSYINRGKHMGITHPNIIVPVTAHAAFLKAAHMFGAECVQIPLDTKTYKVDINKVKRAINRNTVLLVGSCPNFPHGIMDDIEGLSALAVKYKVPLHVDCCLGGFLVAFFQRANIKLPKYDFSLPGVTSISADLHKYGLCPKGISLLMYSKHEYRKYNYFIYPHFMGGLYLTPSFDGSRTAGLIAASYAIVISMGRNHYIAIARAVNAAVVKVREFIKKECPLLTVIGEPCICTVAFTSEKVNYFYDGLSRKGWHVNMILKPLGCSFVFTSANVDNVDTFIADIKDVHKQVLEGTQPELSESTKLYGMTVPMPEKVAVKSLDTLLDAMLD